MLGCVHYLLYLGDILGCRHCVLYLGAMLGCAHYVLYLGAMLGCAHYVLYLGDILECAHYLLYLGDVLGCAHCPARCGSDKLVSAFVWRKRVAAGREVWLGSTVSDNPLQTSQFQTRSASNPQHRHSLKPAQIQRCSNYYTNGNGKRYSTDYINKHSKNYIVTTTGMTIVTYIVMIEAIYHKNNTDPVTALMQ